VTVEGWLPQWSPPLNGGSTYPNVKIGRRIQVPQWSPPPSGGSTEMPLLHAIDRLMPQWSPAAKRREHPLRVSARRPARSCCNGARRQTGALVGEHADEHLVHHAAMEPAAERRERRSDVPRTTVNELLPQWDPPLISESTSSILLDLMAAKAPQWSPPVSGGNTR
jgi:hypothetical protein